MIFNSIKKLVTYGLETGLITEEDRIFTTNELLELLNLDEYEEPEETYTDVELESTLAEILDYACENGLLEDSIVYRDLFDTRIMGLLTPRPHEVIRTFQELYAKSPKEATNAYWISLSTFPNQRKTRKQSLPQRLLNRADILNASFVWRISATGDAPTTRRARTTASCRLP